MHVTVGFHESIVIILRYVNCNIHRCPNPFADSIHASLTLFPKFLN